MELAACPGMPGVRRSSAAAAHGPYGLLADLPAAGAAAGRERDGLVASRVG